MNGVPRALRHLGLTLGIWIGARALFVAFAGFASQTANVPRHDFASISVVPRKLLIASAVSPATPIERKAANTIGEAAAVAPYHEPVTSDRVQAAPIRIAPAEVSGAPAASPPFAGAVPVLASSAKAADKWSLSAWGIYRPDTGSAGIAPNSQLGGGQFGLRVQRRLLEPADRIVMSLNLRASTPLKVSQGKETALGVSIRREGRVPVELIAERRIGLDRGGRDAFAALASTGISDLPIAAGFKLSGYAQAGLVGLRSHDGFVDGSLRLERKVAARGKVLVQLGGGVWGAVQPGVSRVDLGPSAAVRFRVGAAGVRLGGEWRQRVTGNARPGSGPAISFGLDY